MLEINTLKAQLDVLKKEHARLKSNTNVKKLIANSTFGKLGSMYSSFYAPELMLAVTLTGQLHLLSLIYDIESHPEIKVVSANTDGVTIMFPERLRDRVTRVLDRSSKETGFEYDRVEYVTLAMRDVNSYVAVKADGKLKLKGLFAETSLNKNPNFEICAEAVAEYLRNGTYPSETIRKSKDITKFVSIRNVKGGGIEYEGFVEVDDWVLIQDNGNATNVWRREGDPDVTAKRKSRPKPVMVGVGGTKFGRLARWYMQLGGTGKLNYVGSGNTVPLTEGGRLLMTLPTEFPEDIDMEWYVKRAVSMLEDVGIKLDN